MKNNKNNLEILKKIIIKLFFSILALLLASILVISLYSYNMFDPSPFMVTDSEPENKLGVYGAWISSILLNLFGQLSWLIIIALLNIACLIFLLEMKEARLLLRVFFLCVSLILLSISLTYFGINTGLVGKIIILNLNPILDSYNKYFSLGLYSFLLTMGCISTSWVCGYKNVNLLLVLARLLKLIFLFFCSLPLNLIQKLKVNKGQPKNKIYGSSTKQLKKEVLKDKEKLFQNDLEYVFPSINLLNFTKISKKKQKIKGLEETSRLLERVLDDFGIKGDIVQYQEGPVVTRFEFEPAPGTRSSRVIALSDDIARSMSASSARVSVISGRNAMGIELPNSDREMVSLRDILTVEKFNLPGELNLALGKDIAGDSVIANLSIMPHLLIAGTTGSGKSVAVNAMILSLLYNLTPEQCRFIMVDPKMLELSVYEDIPHLLHPVVTDPKKAVSALRWAVREMNERYRQMSLLGVRNIESYNNKIEKNDSLETVTRKIQTGFDDISGRPVYQEQEISVKKMPSIVIVVDEMADLMLTAGKEIEMSIQSLAQKARAAGIHLILATQRPSVDVITGTIKANLPYRISFQVTSKIDSRTILGEQGAEQLLGKGDMLYMMGGGYTERIHGPLVSDEEVMKVANHLRKQGSPEYLLNITEENDLNDDTETTGAENDELFEKALELIIREQKVSTSFLQRHLAIGYNRAARIVDAMENKGMISASNAIGRREVLITK